MDDTDSIFSDDSDTEYFPEDLLNNIPEDSDSDYSDEDNPENNFTNIDSSPSPLELEVGLTFPTWKTAFNHIKQWSLQQGFFYSKRKI